MRRLEPSAGSSHSLTDDRSSGLVSLVPVDLVGPERLYSLLYASGAYKWWRTRGRSVTLAEFVSMMQSDHSYAVVDRRTSGLCGYVGLYATDDVARVASLSMYFDAHHADAGLIAGETIRQFLLECFGLLGLEKVMVESPASEAHRFRRRFAWADALEEEAVLKSQVMFDGEVQDLHLFAIWRTAFLARPRRARLVPDSEQDALEIVATLIGEILGEPLEVRDGGLELEADIGLSSLDLIELVDRLEQLGCAVGDIEAVDSRRPVVLQDLVELVERCRVSQ